MKSLYVLESKTLDPRHSIKCPTCGKETDLEEWRKDAWRCRGCAEYLPYKIRSKYFKTLDPGKKLTVRKKLVKRPKVLRCIDFKGGGLIRVLERTTDHFPEFALYMKMSKALRESLIDAGFTQEQRNKWVLRTNLFSIFVYT